MSKATTRACKGSPAEAVETTDQQIAELRSQVSTLQQQIQSLQAGKRVPRGRVGRDANGRRIRERTFNESRQDKFLEMVRAFDARRIEWEAKPEDAPPGAWYFHGIRDLVAFLADRVESFDDAARGLLEAGYILLRITVRGNSLGTIHVPDQLSTLLANIARAAEYHLETEEGNRLTAKERIRLPLLAEALRETFKGETDVGLQYINQVARDR
jgi:hypothetical protein